MENLTTFWYLVSPLDQTDYDWPSVRRNIMRARSVWGVLGTLIRQEGADPRVTAMLYRAVVQEILLYGSETWVLSTKKKRKAEGTHTGFLRHIMGK